MSELSEGIKYHRDKFNIDEFEVLCRNLASMNLEEAIDKTEMSDVSFDTLRKIVWDYINKKDLLQLQKLSQSKQTLRLLNY